MFPLQYPGHLSGTAPKIRDAEDKVLSEGAKKQRLAVNKIVDTQIYNFAVSTSTGAPFFGSWAKMEYEGIGGKKEYIWVNKSSVMKRLTMGKGKISTSKLVNAALKSRQLSELLKIVSDKFPEGEQKKQSISTVSADPREGGISRVRKQRKPPVSRALTEVEQQRLTFKDKKKSQLQRGHVKPSSQSTEQGQLFLRWSEKVSEMLENHKPKLHEKQKKVYEGRLHELIGDLQKEGETSVSDIKLKLFNASGQYTEKEIEEGAQAIYKYITDESV